MQSSSASTHWSLIGSHELLLRLRLRGQGTCGIRRELRNTGARRARQRGARRRGTRSRPRPRAEVALLPAAQQARRFPARSSSRPASSSTDSANVSTGPGARLSKAEKPCASGARRTRTRVLDALRLLRVRSGLGAEAAPLPWGRARSSPRFVFTRDGSPCCAFSASISNGRGACALRLALGQRSAEVECPRACRAGGTSRELQL